MRFTIRQLTYFIAASEAGSIKLASEQVNISQPSISAAISDLEDILGVKLLVRHHAQGVTVTPEGRRVLTEAKSVLRQCDQLQTLAHEISSEVVGPVTVGSLVTVAPLVLPRLVSAFAAAHPRASIVTREEHQEELLVGLRQAEIDIAVTYDLDIPADIDFHAIVELAPYALLAEGHALAGRSAVPLEALAEDALVLLDLPVSRDYFLSLFMARGLRPRIAARSRHPEVVRAMVANGLGYGLANMPVRCTQALDGRCFKAVPLTGSYRPMVLGIATTRNSLERRAVQAFNKHCRQALTELLR